MEEIGLVAMLATKRSAGFVPEVNLREHATCMPLPIVNKAAHSETQRTCHQKSKMGVSVVQKNDLQKCMSSKKIWTGLSALSVKF